MNTCHANLMTGTGFYPDTGTRRPGRRGEPQRYMRITRNYEFIGLLEDSTKYPPILGSIVFWLHLCTKARKSIYRWSYRGPVEMLEC